jgi:hypothetical protein
MTRHTALLFTTVSFASALAVVGLLEWSLARRPATGSVYSVTQIVNGAMLHPKDWDGRVVWVRALASVSLQTIFQAGSQTGHPTLQILFSPIPARWSTRWREDGMIQVLPGHEDRLLALLRRLPLIGAVAPLPQQVSMTHAATYQIRMHLASHSCNFSPCVTAALMDAAPLADPTVDLPYGL